MAVWLRAGDGDIQDLAPHEGGVFTLAELHAAVGGYIELVRAGTDADGITSTFFVVNEEGKLMGLEVNVAASILFYESGGNPYDVLVGDVLLVSRAEMGES